MPQPRVDCVPSAGRAHGDWQATCPVIMLDCPCLEGVKVCLELMEEDAVLVAAAAAAAAGLTSQAP